MTHTTVLLQEAVDGLELAPGDTVVDATFGSGGHAGKIITRLDKTGCYIGIDVDPAALHKAALPPTEATVQLVQGNFGQIKDLLRSLHIEGVDALLADLGWRMEQFEAGERGFSFLHDGPLTMTYGDPGDYPFTAEDIVNEWEEHVLADVFYGYAEERFARRIARAIVVARTKERITTTAQLVEIIKAALPKAARYKRLHPATKTFQALRIAVNDELTVLETFIKDGFEVLRPGGRLAIITFHSIEDRVVKHAFRELVSAELGILTPKKLITPSQEEVKQNPRARSAKLRIISKHK